MKELRKELNIKKKKMSQNKSYMKVALMLWLFITTIFILIIISIIFFSPQHNPDTPITPTCYCPDCRHPQIIVVNESQITESGGYLYYAIE